ncbi:Dual oxidase maturation factor [Trichinella pseudospiralis]
MQKIGLIYYQRENICYVWSWQKPVDKFLKLVCHRKDQKHTAGEGLFVFYRYPVYYCGSKFPLVSSCGLYNYYQLHCSTESHKQYKLHSSTYKLGIDSKL